MKRFSDFTDGTSVAFYNPADTDPAHTAFESSLSAESATEALESALQLPIMDYQRRLTSFRNIVERFPLDAELREALLEAMDENALNLAAKTLPMEKVDAFLANTSIPLDDIGFARPPTTSEAMEVAQCWDITKTEDVYTAAALMFDEIKDSFTEQDIKALEKAKQSGDTFMQTLHEIVQNDIRDTGYYQRFADY